MVQTEQTVRDMYQCSAVALCCVFMQGALGLAKCLKPPPPTCVGQLCFTLRKRSRLAAFQYAGHVE